MKKRLYFITTLFLSAALLSLSSCLKDSRYVNFGAGSPVVEFNLGGQSFFGADAITSTADTITEQFAVSVASVSIPTTATTVQLAVDNSIITSYNAANPGVVFTPFPTGTYSLSTTTVNIPAGQRVGIVTLTIYKSLLDPAQSYMLPVKIASTSGGYTISGNMGIHYYHIIGNDFAGSYRWQYQRYSGATDSVSVPLNGSSFTFAAGNKATFTPVSPTEFTVYSGYVSGQEIRYDVTFSKTGSTTANSSYTNFHVKFVPDDVTSIGNSGITVQQSPVFFDPATGKPGTADLAGPYTFAQAQKIFHFNWIAHTSAPRYILDTYLP